MASDSGPDHDSVGIDGLAMLTVTLSGADRTEEPVFGENPHGSLLLPLPLHLSNLRHKKADLISAEVGNRRNPVNVAD